MTDPQLDLLAMATGQADQLAALIDEVTATMPKDARDELVDLLDTNQPVHPDLLEPAILTFVRRLAMLAFGESIVRVGRLQLEEDEG